MQTTQELQAQRNAEHVMFARLANQARAAGKLKLAESYEEGMAMIRRLYERDAKRS